MKKTILVIILLLLSSTASFAERSVSGFDSFDEYRQLGEYRLWTFIAQDSLLGTYTSTIKDQININGVSGFVIEQRLKLDYNIISTELVFDIINRHFVAENGMYLGDKMKISINDQSEEADFERDESTLEGYITRNDNKIEQKINLKNIKYAIENHYIDELEMYLASLDLTIGTRFDDTIFMSQSLVESQVSGIVQDFKNVQLYNKVFDSVFVIEFTYPTMMTAYFGPEKRLVKLEVPSQELKVYLDVVNNPLKTKLSAQKSTNQNLPQSTPIQAEKSIIEIIILYSMYLVFGVLVTFLFVRNFYKKTESYLIFLVGGLSFVLMPFIQFPLQEYFFNEYFVPHVLKSGESAILWGILPALTAGVVQEIILVIVLFFLYYKLKDKKINYISIGAMIGLGFGLAEAMYLAYGTPSSLYFGMNLVERIFLIMFHISACMFLSHTLKEGYQKTAQFLTVTILLNSAMRYLPIFVQNKVLTPELLGILLALLSVSFLTLTMYLIKQKK